MKTSFDKNHLDIVRLCRAHGWSVYDGASVGRGASDLIVAGPRAVTVLCEIKNPDQASYFYYSQLMFISKWIGHVAIVLSFEDVKNAVTDPMAYCLSAKQKHALSALAFRERVKAGDKPLKSLRISTKKVLDAIGNR